MREKAKPERPFINAMQLFLMLHESRAGIKTADQRADMIAGALEKSLPLDSSGVIAQIADPARPNLNKEGEILYISQPEKGKPIEIRIWSGIQGSHLELYALGYGENTYLSGPVVEGMTVSHDGIQKIDTSNTERLVKLLASCELQLAEE